MGKELGEAWRARSSFGTNGKAVVLQLPTTGTYTVQLDPQDAPTGSVTASLG